MTKVLLMRHAETAVPNVFHGAESDVPLGARGFQQAALVAQHIATLKPDVIISSNMTRARQTATPIAQACGIDFQIEPKLHERQIGSMSGTLIESENSLWQLTSEKWASGETSFAHPGAESFDDMQARILPIFQNITQVYAEKTIVLVVHGIVCKVLLCSILKGYNVADWQQLGRINNVSISTIIGSGQEWRAERIGEVIDPVRQLNEKNQTH